MKKLLTAILLTLALVSSVFATTRKVLFIGNSYTYTNNMPLILQSLAASMGDTLIYDESDPGGYTFAMHSTYTPTITKIFSRQWDLVVLQEQSQLPSFPPDEVDTEVYPYAHKLDSMIHANYSCTQTLFLMTWGHADGDPMNCAFYPAICTYDGMQQRLRESYLQMTHDNAAIVAPVGMAWKKVMDSIPSIWLFSPDSSHPIVPGSYLEACVLYSSIFHRHTLGCTYTSGLTTTVAGTLQQVSDRVVFDSLSQWQQYGHYPYAGFAHAQSGTTVTYTSLSPVAVSNSWDFGDHATDTAHAPVHHYAGTGTYVATHTVTNSCFTETLTDTIRIGTAAAQILTGESAHIVISQGGNGRITFDCTAASAGTLELYDATGRQVRKYAVNGAPVHDQLIPGMYLYRAYSADGSSFVNGKVIIY